MSASLTLGESRARWAGLIIVFVVGCATPPVKEPTTSAWRERVAQLAATQVWTMRGKLAVTHRGRRGLMNFTWKRDGRSFQIDLYSTFRHIASFESAPEGVRARHGDGEILAATPEDALRKLLGFSAPITLMRHWVLGIPSPQLEIEELTLNDEGRAGAIAQGGWRVEYESYQRVGAVWVPQKLVVQREGIGGGIELTAWITEWSEAT